jgi:hypothetical protein
VSTALAIASVTAVLKDLLNNGLIDHNVSASVGNVTVSALPPDKIDIEGGGQTSQLNLFLYQVTPNPGWRSVGLPGRDAAGERIANPPLALNLHYLLMAYGAEELHGEILLGYGMQLLHETPVLTRDAIRRSLAPPSPVAAGPGLPQSMRALFTSELAEQVEQIRITPAAMNVDELSKLWTAFQSKFRPAAAYEATVVLIHSRRTTRGALPVTQRNLHVVPLRFPLLEKVLSQANVAAPVVEHEPILEGQRLVLRGSQLAGAETLVAIDGATLAPLPQDVGNEQVSVAIPAATPAGLHGVQVVHRMPMGTPPVPHRGVESNALPFVLSPRIDGAPSASNVQGSGGAPRNANVNLTVKPALGPMQRAILLMNEFATPLPENPRAYSFALPPRIDLQNPPANLPPPTENLSVPVAGVAAGSYLLRIQVDGAVSPLEMDPNQASPTFHRFVSPVVSIP